MKLSSPAGRLAREQRTIEAMVRIYCRERHGGPALCDDCGELRAYAEKRLVHCPFGPDKPTCANCKVHCYQAQMRERVRTVMRETGPRMLLRHPYLAFMHLFVDSKRAAPDRPPSRRVKQPA